MSALSILGLQAENFARLRAVSLQIQGGSLVVSGRNGQGKSSVLAAIESALCGKSAAPALPVHEGASGASVRVTLGAAPNQVELVVERTWKDGREQLVVKNADGVRQATAQSVLDALRGALGFDVMAFAEPPGARTADAADKRRLEMLLEIAPLPIDLEKHEDERRRIYDERTATSRALREAESERALATVRSVPERVDVTALSDELERAGEHNSRIERCKSAIQTIDRDGFRLAEEIADLERAIAAKRLEIEKGANTRAQFREELEALGKPVDVSPLREQIASASSANEARAKVIAENDRNRAARERADRLAGDVKVLTGKLERLDAKKAEALASVALPGGLTLTEDGRGVLLNGRPFSAASSSERIRASVRVMAARNPRLRACIVRDGNDLDSEAMREVLAFAEESGLQLFVERIAADMPGCVVIEDGSVAS